jgi:putative intracellular protease/amidase
MNTLFNRRQFTLAGAALLGTAALSTRARAAARRPRIAMVITSTAKKPNGMDTGLWMAELTTPYWAFVDAGFDVALYSIAGGEPPIDPRSVNLLRGLTASVRRFKGHEGAMAAYRQTARIDAFDAKQADAIFLCGGHGTMFDFRDSAALIGAVEAVDRQGGLVAAICHGPAGLLGARRADGRPFVEGRAVTGFTDAEEDAVKLTQAVPFLLETELRKAGARFVGAPNFEAHALRSGNLVTGQNPASAERTAALVVEALAAILGARG